MTTAMQADTAITPDLIAKHGITPEEYQQIRDILGRHPNITELGIFSVMWSEHCSYKNSRPELKKFPTDGPSILVKAGEENAGIVDVGDGWAISFKIESHNHPSAVEPFQGAATGVGGIIRDIFTMGARPILNMNSLRFGPIDSVAGPPSDADLAGEDAPGPEPSQSELEPTSQANRRLFAGVVAGIAHYGNCIGIPTVGGEVYFDESYNGNPLVNALSLGILRHDQIQRGAATGVGNPVIYVGSATGRDGLAGAAFASRELTEESHQDRPAVQVGDPFMEKLLLEACLEVMRHDGLIVGIQDMGAAGLTCSTCETASRGGSGVEIDLEKVPKRESGMIPYEIMLSESQERMLLIAARGREREVEAIFEKWDLHGVTVGRVTDDGKMRVTVGNETVAEIPAARLAEDAPVYFRDARQPASEIRHAQFDLDRLPQPEDYRQVLLDLLAMPSIASKNWVYRQYDHMVQDGTVVLPGSDAAVIRINLTRPDLSAPRPTDRASGRGQATKYIAFTTDCNAVYCYLDPYEGGKTAVAEAARNLVCSGARPVAVTDCLNFGNPMKAEVFWQFRRCVEGVSEACRRFNTPVTGGNVSFYNESPKGAVDPTPTIGMLGLIEDPAWITTQWFKQEGDPLLLLGDPGNELGGSQYLQRVHRLKTGPAPRLDLEIAARLNELMLTIIRRGLVRSAHDCAEGGLAVALAECCFSNPHGPGRPGHPGEGGESPGWVGAEIDLGRVNGRLDALLFGESQSRILVSASADHRAAILEEAATAGLPVTELGTTGGDQLRIKTDSETLAWDLASLHDPWWNTISRLMDR